MAQCNRQLANDYDDDDGDDGDDEKLETFIMMMMMAMMVMMRNWKRLSLILYNNCAFIAHYMVWLREIPLL